MSIEIALPDESKWTTIAEGDETQSDVAVLKLGTVEIFRSRSGPPVDSPTRHNCRSATTVAFRVGPDGEWDDVGLSERKGFERAVRHALRIMLEGEAV